MEVNLYVLLAAALDDCEWSARRSGCCTPSLVGSRAEMWQREKSRHTGNRAPDV